jgi:hypothetical protein
MNVFEAIKTGEVGKMIAVIDPAFKKAAKEAAERARAAGIEVADGRKDEPSPISEPK